MSHLTDSVSQGFPQGTEVRAGLCFTISRVSGAHSTGWLGLTWHVVGTFTCLSDANKCQLGPQLVLGTEAPHGDSPCGLVFL